MVTKKKPCLASISAVLTRISTESFFPEIQKNIPLQRKITLTRQAQLAHPNILKIGVEFGLAYLLNFDSHFPTWFAVLSCYLSPVSCVCLYIIHCHRLS